MTATERDHRVMAAALALAERGRGRTAPNPNVGCLIVAGDRVVGRGWTQPGGRPHAEAVALDEAGEQARGATVYVTLEPCAHESPRGPACADLLVAAAPARVVVALVDPDARTAGRGVARLEDAGIAVTLGCMGDAAKRVAAGFFSRRERGRPFVTLKLATSLDGAIATESGESKWITADAARAHAHGERSRHELILVGRGTWEADQPRLDVRLCGLEERSPTRVVLSAGPHPSHSPAASGPLPSPSGTGREARERRNGEDLWLPAPVDIATLPGDHLLIEGGMHTAASFLAADLVDRLLLYRAPILIGGGRTLPNIGLPSLNEAHGRWRLTDARALGSDRVEVYERT